MLDDDVVVVGGGLAGSMAALAAARSDANVSVGLVTTKETTLTKASGLVDVLGYTPDGSGPVADPFGAIPELPAHHPYQTVGVETVRDGLALFDDVTDETYGGSETDRNALVPTYFGKAKPTARYPDSVEAGLVSEQRPTTLVGFERLPAFDAALAAARLDERYEFDVSGLGVSFPRPEDNRTDNDLGPVECARLLDENPDVDGDSLREALVEKVEMYQSGEERIGFAGVLGFAQTAAIRDELADAFGIRVFEVPMGPPSVLGRRLGTRLREALSTAGVTLQTATRVEDVRETGGAVDELVLDDGSAYRGSQFVLATGGLTGGGIESDRATVREPLFDCHVDAPGDRYDWFDDEAFGAHEFARFGVEPDDQLRPLDATGKPEYSNLRAAGHVIGGFDFAAEKSGSGVSIATGYAAGTRATERA